MEALIQVIESTMAARDPYTAVHQRRVTLIASAIGREMGLSQDRLGELQIASRLHDLGKIAIPADLLSKPGNLTIYEFALLKTHPQVAYNILKPIKLPGATAEIILQHHERLDGSGYPRGLRGREILLEARILGVADVLEAMCSHRPYRASQGLADTLDELTRNQGILYDAAVVQTCLKLYREELPVSPAVDCGLTPLEVNPPGPPMPLKEVVPAPDILARLSLWPPGRGKPKRWTKFFTKTPRIWMHLGSAAIMGLLMMASFRGM